MISPMILGVYPLSYRKTGNSIVMTVRASIDWNVDRCHWGGLTPCIRLYTRHIENIEFHTFRGEACVYLITS